MLPLQAWEFGLNGSLIYFSNLSALSLKRNYEKSYPKKGEHKDTKGHRQALVHIP